MFDAITMPMTQLLLSLASLLTPIGGMAAAIVVVTLAVRAALHPLTRRAVRGERARQSLVPELAALRKRHADAPARLAEESMKLYRAAGVSPLAGLMPVLAQAPVFILLFQSFSDQTGGTALAARAFSGVHTVPFLALLAGLTVVAWFTSRRAAMLTRVNTSLVGSADPTAGSGLLMRLPRILPYATVASALVLPMALVIYLLTSSAWTLAENALLRRGLPA